MKKILFIILLVTVIAIIGYSGFVYYTQLRGVKPAISPPASDIADLITKHNELPPGENGTEFPLQLPNGFKIEVFAKDLPGARVMAFDGSGNVWVSQTSENKISLLEVVNGEVVGRKGFTRLKKPHGLAVTAVGRPMLYVAEEDKISATVLGGEWNPGKIIDLPSTKTQRHFTRTIGIGPDNRLYVSIGSSCDVCHEKDERRGTVYSLNPDGTDFQLFARGLRNAVFFAWHPVTGKLWATEMGRDGLGDDLPPDEINIVEEGKNYGWPICYGKNIHDDKFDKNIYIRNPCTEPFEVPSYLDLPAHSAPLGLAFVPELWGEEYVGDLLMAYHGSWNRSDPTGYKIVRIPLNEKGEADGEPTDFISGWLTEDDKALGRPVDLKFGADGALYVSDDKAGLIYRVTFIQS